MKILFIGTAEFAVPPLQKLLEIPDVEVVGIVTQPDRPAGRGRKLTASPVKDFYNDANTSAPLFQPEKLRDEAEQILQQTEPELIVVAAYGQMIPDVMLSKPKHGAWNLHGSLLPELRGAVPVQMAILQGLTKTGVTIQQMVKELDAGDILMQESVVVEPTDTTESLMQKLALKAAGMLPAALNALHTNSLKPQPQDGSKATFCYQSDLTKQLAEITANTATHQAERMVRAFNPWPVAWITLQSGSQQGKRLQIYSAKVSDAELEGVSGNVVKQDKQLFLLLNNGALELLEVQLEGKNHGSAAEYLYLA